MSTVLNGLDVLREDYWKKLKGRRLGLLSNQASLDSALRPAKVVIDHVLPGRLKALFGPQHGHGGEDQDNMIETAHSLDPELNIPIFSLYSNSRQPLPEMLEGIDTLIIDLQDVGTRVYTFASTTLNCLKAASSSGKGVVILDRPNPLGGNIVEGNLLRPELYSFVGPFKLPMRHGLTLGEMAKIFIHAFRLEVELDVVPMSGWTRGMRWFDTGLQWIMPSPNMPIPETAFVYPGQVIWEGTNISEGRGTCRPFEIFGAPFLDTGAILEKLSPESQAGCRLQPFSFRPTFHKWAGEICRGFMIHILDPNIFRPYFLSMSLLYHIIKIHGEHFEWKSPPYEYEVEKRPIDMIIGDSSIRRAMEQGTDPEKLKEAWLSALQDYLEWRKPYLMYK
ncbi:MAG: DUF1343 domain-containing protein [Pseudomonadota bacterium]